MHIMATRRGVWTLWILSLLLWLAVLGPAAAAGTPKAELDNTGCLRCHDSKAHKLKVDAADGKSRALLAVMPDKYGQSVHGQMQCVACHTGITDSPPAGQGHQLDPGLSSKSLGCAECHQALWDTARKDNTASAKPGLGVVVDNIEAYRKSFHARASKDEPDKVNATCDNCHDTHSFRVPAKDSPAHAQWRLDSSALCGESCHSDALDDYTASVHGKEALDKGNAKSAVCFDCHNAHAVGNTSATPFKLAITARCGDCHTDELPVLQGHLPRPGQHAGLCLHRQVLRLPRQPRHPAIDDPKSKVHADNRLKTCQTCHSGKKDLAGHRRLRHASSRTAAPTTSRATRRCGWGRSSWSALLLGTFGFFWAHTALWFYREYKDRQQSARCARTCGPRPAQRSARRAHVRRFSAGWRLAHLVFALSLMLLTLTGMPLFYPDAAWAPWVMQALGGPKVAGQIHRVSAVVFGIVFFGHLVVMAIGVWRRRKTFHWFGPDSLIPNLQDLKDIVAMFKWFVGKGPRPVFDRWTYWEKFDYWAPFWGITIIGISGLMLWLPTVTGASCPAGSSTWRPSSTARRRSSRWCSCSPCTSSTTTSGPTSSRSRRSCSPGR